MGHLEEESAWLAGSASVPASLPPLPFSALTELDKHILGFVKGNLLKILAHESLDWPLVPIRGYLLAQEIVLGKQTGLHWGRVQGQRPRTAVPPPL